MKQQELFKIFCRCEDDNGHICGKSMPKAQFKQDGMCAWCADGVWNSIQNNIPFFHLEARHGQASDNCDNQG